MAIALGLAACGGGSSTTMTDDGDMMERTAQEMCEDDGGRWNADMTCTSAEDVAEEEAAKVAAATAAAVTKETAIAAEAGTDGTDGLGGTAAPATGTGAYTLAIDEDGTTVSITVEGATDDDDVMFDVTDMMDGRTMHTLTQDADDDGNVVTEVAIVYNDRDAPTLVAFEMYESATGRTQELNARDLDADVDADGDGDLTNDFTALNVVDANRALIMASAFSSAGAGTLSYTIDDTDTDDIDEAFETAGTYNGALGTYRCNDTSDDCTVKYDEMGVIEEVTGTWIFTPDMGAESPQQQWDYLNYGFWLMKTEDADGEVTYNEVQTFAGSSLTASGDVSAVEGRATYTGGAVGVYVMNHEYDSTSGDLVNATSGHFKADVILTATFGGSFIAADDQDRVTGTIDNFMFSDDEANDWSVALVSDGDPAVDGIQPDTDGTLAGTASGGVDGMDGSFSATYYGTDDQPSQVIGEFNSVFDNGSAAGAFGANIDDDE
ncbi:MAG: hypothetical protein J4G15_08470 [Alphaproteobacteria bacterium]|nr:hypothetical protein [Alphaproteobacteria bacterium]